MAIEPSVLQGAPPIEAGIALFPGRG